MSEPVKKILIANRGEIALRIIHTAKEMGIATVGIYSTADSGSLWIQQCTEAYALGDGNISETYLNIPKIIAVAKRSGADAIHPGYGFLSENYLFAKACEEYNINFIGPSSNVLKLMGDKIAADAFVRGLDIAVLNKVICSPAEMRDMEETLDYPIMVKAASGGGGKGMRLVRRAEDLTAALTMTSNEALRYFADDRIFLEKYLHAPRHIEVQLLGDKQGNMAHLYERECSIQRRHQKVIEEAPAVILANDTRDAIIQAALEIARALKYYSAGTVEFLLDEQGQFFFLEMNPRLQVEHGVTEMITGIDIVREQLAIAGGFPISFPVEGVSRNGHAIEARIFAEDPENNLLPSPGQIGYYRQPEMGGLRIDSAVSVSAIISPDYDPLIAKVLVHAPTRQAAMGKLKLALDQFVITGLPHNIPLIRLLLQDEDFIGNALSTNFLSEKMPEFTAALIIQRGVMSNALLAIAAAISILFKKNSAGMESPWQSMGYWRNVPQIRFRIQDDIIELDYYVTAADSLDFVCKDLKYTVTRIHSDAIQTNFTIDDHDYCFYRLPEHDGILEISDGKISYRVERFNRLQYVNHPAVLQSLTVEDGIIRSPLPGKILHVHVSEGDLVKKGDHLLVIESMKLENGILALYPGVIQHINVKAGEYVKKDTTLLNMKQIINVK